MPSYNFLLAANIALAIVACNCRADLIDDVCSKSRNATSCGNNLRLDPRSKGADLKGIAVIAIEKSQEAVRATGIEAEGAYLHPGIKGFIANCVNGVNGAKEALNDCSGILQGVVTDPSIKKTLYFRSSTALDDTKICSFGSNTPANLEQATQKALDLISALVAVSMML